MAEEPARAGGKAGKVRPADPAVVVGRADRAVDSVAQARERGDRVGGKPVAAGLEYRRLSPEQGRDPLRQRGELRPLERGAEIAAEGMPVVARFDGGRRTPRMEVGADLAAFRRQRADHGRTLRVGRDGLVDHQHGPQPVPAEQVEPALQRPGRHGVADIGVGTLVPFERRLGVDDDQELRPPGAGRVHLDQAQRPRAGREVPGEANDEIGGDRRRRFAAIEGGVAARDRGEVEIAFGEASVLAAEGLPPLGVGGELGEGGGEIGLGRGEVAGLPWPDEEVGKPRQEAHDDGQAVRHRLDQDVGEAFRGGGEDEHVGRPVVGCGVVAEADQADPVREPEFGGPALDLGGEIGLEDGADDDQHHPRVGDPSEGFDQPVRALASRYRADVEQQHGVLGQAQGAALGKAFGIIGRCGWQHRALRQEHQSVARHRLQRPAQELWADHHEAVDGAEQLADEWTIARAVAREHLGRAVVEAAGEQHAPAERAHGEIGDERAVDVRMEMQHVVASAVGDQPAQQGDGGGLPAGGEVVHRHPAMAQCLGPVGRGGLVHEDLAG
nr:hypothetical protein [Elioraea thermophila]